MKKKIITAILISIFAVNSLTGCGNKTIYESDEKETNISLNEIKKENQQEQIDEINEEGLTEEQEALRLEIEDEFFRCIGELEKSGQDYSYCKQLIVPASFIIECANNGYTNIDQFKKYAKEYIDSDFAQSYEEAFVLFIKDEMVFKLTDEQLDFKKDFINKLNDGADSWIKIVDSTTLKEIENLGEYEQEDINQIKEEANREKERMQELKSLKNDDDFNDFIDEFIIDMWYSDIKSTDDIENCMKNDWGISIEEILKNMPEDITEDDIINILYIDFTFGTLDLINNNINESDDAQIETVRDF